MSKSASEIYEYLNNHLPEFQERFGGVCATEAELVKVLGSERFATRRALQRLVSERRIFHVRNQGYHFNHQSFDVSLDSGVSYSRFCLERNLVPKSELISASQERASASLVSTLGLTQGDLVWHLVFHRFVGEVPFCLTDSWLPLERTRGLLGYLRKTGSLYKALREYFDIEVQRSSSKITALPADKEEAKLLDTALAWPLLKVDSLAECHHGRPIEYCETRYRSDMVSFTVDLRGTKKTRLTTSIEGSDYDPTTTH